MPQGKPAGKLRPLDLGRDFEELALLNVRADNLPAIRLYESLGFVKYDSTTQLRLDGTPDVKFKPVEGYSLRPMGLGEWRTRYALAKEAVPPEVREYNPISEREYSGRLLQDGP